MILPIVAYGDPVLRKQAQNIQPDYPNLQQLIADMFDTMYNAHGIGLAAPQIGKSILLFITDGSRLDRKDHPKEDMSDFKKVFINPQILSESGDVWNYEEGCLSIPGIREDVSRKAIVTIRYQTETWDWKEEEYDGMKARIIQHEYDHLMGKLFVDYAPNFRRLLIKNKLNKIAKGNIEVSYPMFIYSKSQVLKP
ncbi:MAG: peptide deformylase [Bacteroidia bacterium]|nr:peptide deformylase [Bacteroidia bacterium]